MIKIFALVVAAIPCVGGCTYGQPGPTSSMAEPVAPPGDATMHRHFGFFLRPDLGAGYMVTSEPTGTTSGDLTISGCLSSEEDHSTLIERSASLVCRKGQIKNT